MAEKYTWYRIHKSEDFFERGITQDVEQHVLDWFGVDEIEDLTEDHIQEVIDFREELNEYSVMQIGFSNVINMWESMVGEL